MRSNSLCYCFVFISFHTARMSDFERTANDLLVRLCSEEEAAPTVTNGTSTRGGNNDDKNGECSVIQIDLHTALILMGKAL